MGSQCRCQKGWTKDDCSCPPEDISNEYCRDALTGRICSDKGLCECGECDCDRGYEGKYCQRSADRDTCKKLEPCVKADQFKSTNSSDDPGMKDFQN